MNQPSKQLSPRQFSRRRFLQLSGTGVAATLLLTACPTPVASPGAPAAGGETAASAPAAEGAALTVMAFGVADQKGFAALADAYMQQNPDTKVEAIFLPNDES